jgi:Lipocalin-like domain
MRFLPLIFFVACSPAFAQESNPLVGTWKLIAAESIVENEAPQHTFGLHPKGYLIITQEGRLMIMMTVTIARLEWVMLNGLRCTKQWRR